MALKLSILIPSTPNRGIMTNELYAKLRISKWPNGEYIGAEKFEVLLDWSRDIVGKKRNDLLKAAQGEYVVFVDSDDLVSEDYVSKILMACETGADCIGISGIITTDGKNKQQWHISKEFGSWYSKAGVYYRTPNHISPVKRELALQAGFPEVAFAEDYEYSMRLLPLLKTEATVPGNIYHYKYISNK